MKEVTKSSWFGLRLAHGLQFHPAPNGVSRLAHSGWVWHVRRPNTSLSLIISSPFLFRMSGGPLNWDMPLSVSCEVGWFPGKG